MENEKEISTYEHSDALNVLVELGLVDVVRSDGREAYRLSEALDRADFSPNAALLARLEEAPTLCNDGGA